MHGYNGNLYNKSITNKNEYIRQRNVNQNPINNSLSNTSACVYFIWGIFNQFTNTPGATISKTQIFSDYFEINLSKCKKIKKKKK